MTRITTNEQAIQWLANNMPNVIVKEDNTVTVESCCPRCHGTGYWSKGHWVKNGICFRCNGQKGIVVKHVPVKKFAQQKKAAFVAKEKRERENREKALQREERMLEGQRNWCEKNGFGRITFAEKEELQKIERLEKMQSQRYLGQVGDNLHAIVTLVKTFSFDSRFGTMFIHKFQDQFENVVVWKTSKGLYYPEGIEEGDKVEIKGKVKELSVYNHEKQTVLTRCNAQKIEEND